MATKKPAAISATKNPKKEIKSQAAPPHQDQKASQHEETARLAYKLWEERGRRHGGAEEDWMQAEMSLITVPDQEKVSATKSPRPKKRTAAS